MDTAEMNRWHDRREALFPTKLPHSAISVINQQLPALEAERADRALVSYSKQKPYKGFYMLKYMVHYERAGDGRKPFSGTDGAQRAAAPATNMDEAHHAERREREAYGHLPPDFIAACRKKFADWGWPEGSRAWMLLCLEHYVGRDVEQYRVHPWFGSKEYDAAERRKAAAAAYQANQAQTLVERLRAEIVRLGGRADAIA